MEKKYIHYCWFGGKPLPKLAKKCIKSWKKYLPDYEIIKWSEENVDLNECPFVKEAYENKKWAFVADYVRTKAMYEYGGIYFDTDMEITKNIDFLLEKESFLGVEDSGMIACGVWGEKNPKSYLSSEMLKFYKSLDHFEKDNMFSISIPRIITKLLNPLGFNGSKINEIQTLNKGIMIYPREYFYPYSYNKDNNIFTENTCMIHYYDASWVPKWEQRENKIYRTLGKKNGERFIKFCRLSKRVLKNMVKIPAYPVILYVRKRRKNKYLDKKINQIQLNFKNIKEKKYLAIHNPEWLGTSFSTKELFDNTVAIPSLQNEIEFKTVANLIVETKPKLIIFSAFAEGWKELINEVKNINPDIRIKVLWHGSCAMNIEDYDWRMLKQIFELLNENKVESIGFVKKTMYELYKSKGYNVEFVMNTVTIDNKEQYINNSKSNDKNVKIGLYASGDRWVKNFYNQLAAASLVKNAEIDCIPISNKALEFSKILNININGTFKPVEREELLNRISKNNINIYTTFVECAPLLPLESLELGVPCITGNNHHYWKDTELEKYLIVDAVDDVFEIHKKIELCLKNSNKIMKLYNEWKKEYDKKVKENIQKFLK